MILHGRAARICDRIMRTYTLRCSVLQCVAVCLQNLRQEHAYEYFRRASRGARRCVCVRIYIYSYTVYILLYTQIKCCVYCLRIYVYIRAYSVRIFTYIQCVRIHVYIRVQCVKTYVYTHSILFVYIMLLDHSRPIAWEHRAGREVPTCLYTHTHTCLCGGCRFIHRFTFTFMYSYHHLCIKYLCDIYPFIRRFTFIYSYPYVHSYRIFCALDIYLYVSKYIHVFLFTFVHTYPQLHSYRIFCASDTYLYVSKYIHVFIFTFIYSYPYVHSYRIFCASDIYLHVSIYIHVSILTFDCNFLSVRSIYINKYMYTYHCSTSCVQTYVYVCQYYVYSYPYQVKARETPSGV